MRPLSGYLNYISASGSYYKSRLHVEWGRCFKENQDEEMVESVDTSNDMGL